MRKTLPHTFKAFGSYYRNTANPFITCKLHWKIFQNIPYMVVCDLLFRFGCSIQKCVNVLMHFSQLSTISIQYFIPLQNTLQLRTIYESSINDSAGNTKSLLAWCYNVMTSVWCPQSTFLFSTVCVPFAFYVTIFIEAIAERKTCLQCLNSFATLWSFCFLVALWESS